MKGNHKKGAKLPAKITTAVTGLRVPPGASHHWFPLCPVRIPPPFASSEPSCVTYITRL